VSKTEIFLFINCGERSILTAVPWKGKYATTTTSNVLTFHIILYEYILMLTVDLYMCETLN